MDKGAVKDHNLSETRSASPTTTANSLERTGPAGNGAIVFWPQWWRVFVLGLAMMFAVLLLILVILFAALGWSDWSQPTTWLYVTGAPVVLSAIVAVPACKNFALTVSAKIIGGLGPGEGAFRREPVQIFIEDIDRERSSGRTWRSHILGWQRIYSKDGRCIYFYRAAFSPSDVRRLLALLRIPE